LFPQQEGRTDNPSIPMAHGIAVAIGLAAAIGSASTSLLLRLLKVSVQWAATRSLPLM
jgi:hypothetical protein